jgi:Dit-like tail protein
MSQIPIGSSSLPVVPAYIQYGDPITDPAVALGFVTFDVVTAEEHERTSTITDHPVEEGINVVDHVRPLPDRLTLEAYVSNAPINSPDALRLPLTTDLPQPGQPLLSAGGFLAGGTTGMAQQGLVALGIMAGFPLTQTVLVDQFIGDTDYPRQTYETLTYLRDNAIMLTVHTPRATYKNMLIERIQMHRDAQTGTGANFTIEMREVRIVASSITNAPLPSIPRSNPSLSLGKKDPAAGAAAMQSVALKIGVNTGLFSAATHVTGIPGPSP